MITQCIYFVKAFQITPLFHRLSYEIEKVQDILQSIIPL